MERTRVLSLRHRTFLLLVILAAIAGVLAWGTWQEIRFGSREIKRLMTEQAMAVIDLIAESSAHGLAAYRSWEEEAVRRLMSDALWVAQYDSISAVDDEKLRSLAATHHLHRIKIFDERGNPVASSWTSDHPPVVPPQDSREFLAPILEGRTRSLRIGIRQARFEEGTRLAVAVARPQGGAVVVNISADSLRATLERVGPGHLIRSLGETAGVRYIAIEDADGILAASADLPVLPPLSGDADLLLPGAEQSVVARELTLASGSIFEVARRVQLAEGGPVILRIGLATTALEHTRAALRRHTWMRTGLFAVMVGLAAVLLLAWERHWVLDREVHAVRAELRATEQEALQAQKLAAMGELASGVAHEIRNPLNTIHMIAQQLERDPGLDLDARTQVGHVSTESRRIEGIVQQFLTFARPRQPQLEWLDLAEVASGVAQAAEAAFRSQEIRLLVNADSVWTTADRGFLTEIVENLLRNAREASPYGTEVRLGVRRSGSEAHLIVEDEGPGVPSGLRPRIFDLYFTTKAQGTGLGLALAAQMAASMGGGIRLDEATEQGARFIVRLPIRKESK